MRFPRQIKGAPRGRASVAVRRSLGGSVLSLVAACSGATGTLPPLPGATAQPDGACIGCPQPSAQDACADCGSTFNCGNGQACDVSCGSDCSITCNAASSCAPTCAKHCTFSCGNMASCTPTVGDESDVTCAGVDQCAVVCTGTCRVHCSQTGTCSADCPAGATATSCTDGWACGEGC